MMKKTVLTISALALALSMSAQSMSDGLMFSRNNYVGTARSMAMGNAVTALGGDLGAVTINPAGSAVAPYSQVTISPGLDISIRTTQGTPLNGQHPYFQKKMRNTNTAFAIPNIGFSLNWDTYASRGLKSFTVGFLMNQTQSCSDRTFASGRNSTTSFMGSLAENAYLDGFNGGTLGQDKSWDLAPWDYVAAMHAGLIAPWDPQPGAKADKFIGATEQPGKGNIKYIDGELDQYFGRERHGVKNDYTFNFGMNFNDRIYVGLNLNINSLRYNSMEYMREVAGEGNFGFEYTDNNAPDPSTAPKKWAEFHEGKMTSTYDADGIGFSTRLGVIWNAWKGLRVGAAIQTPTWNKIDERWTTDAITSFSTGTMKGESPLGKNSYRFREPMRASLGLAYVFGSQALVSVDYEVTPYQQMRFTSYDAFSDEFTYTNQDIKDFTGVGHQLRIGTEVKVIPSVALRAGYNFSTSGEYTIGNGERRMPVKAYVHEVGFGIGYSSKGSFFMDLAAKGTFHPDEYIMPYRNYVYEKDVETGEYLKDPEGFLILDPDFLAPEIRNIRNNWKVVLTLGFRF